jgi:translation elongation factor EF-1alpha
VLWSKDRFDEIVTKLVAFLKQSGFNPKDIWFIPCSGLLGENILERKEPNLCSWYNGPTLIQGIGRQKKLSVFWVNSFFFR